MHFCRFLDKTQWHHAYTIKDDSELMILRVRFSTRQAHSTTLRTQTLKGSFARRLANNPKK
jgi:hypothetical protein